VPIETPLGYVDDKSSTIHEALAWMRTREQRFAVHPLLLI
jgi:hypothetical protein